MAVAPSDAVGGDVVLVANGGIEAHLTTNQYVHDFCMLKDLVSKIWGEEGEDRPKLITPDNAFEKKWYGEFLLKAIEAGCPPRSDGSF